MLGSALDALTSVIYPQFCGICGRIVKKIDDGSACSDCWQASHLFTSSDVLCQKCGAYLSTGNPSLNVSCHKCSEHLYDLARACGIYRAALAAEIINLKHTPSVSPRIRRSFIDVLNRLELDEDPVIIPVPLSKKRMFERGYNQAEVLSKIAADHLECRLDKQTLVRSKHSGMHRAAMDRKARERSVSDAFTVLRPNLIKNRSIILIDDLFTTGSTASQCSKVLKVCGAGKVTVVTLARAV